MFNFYLLFFQCDWYRCMDDGFSQMMYQLGSIVANALAILLSKGLIS